MRGEMRGSSDARSATRCRHDGRDRSGCTVPSPLVPGWHGIVEYHPCALIAGPPRTSQDLGQQTKHVPHRRCCCGSGRCRRRRQSGRAARRQERRRRRRRRQKGCGEPGAGAAGRRARPGLRQRTQTGCRTALLAETELTCLRRERVVAVRRRRRRCCWQRLPAACRRSAAGRRGPGSPPDCRQRPLMQQPCCGDGSGTARELWMAVGGATKRTQALRAEARAGQTSPPRPAGAGRRGAWRRRRRRGYVGRLVSRLVSELQPSTAPFSSSLLEHCGCSSPVEDFKIH